MKETLKFRERYNRWKNGENYWEIRADQDLPKFQSGKDDQEELDAGVVITPDYQYNQFLNTLPANLRHTPEDKYRTHFAWNLSGKPKTLKDAKFIQWVEEDNSYHGNSVLRDPKTNIYHFLKPKTHPTVGLELNAYHNNPDLEQLRKSHKIDDSDPNYYRYVPKFRGGKDGEIYEMSPTFDQYVNYTDNTSVAKPVITQPIKVVKPPVIPKMTYLSADNRSESKRALDQQVADQMYAAHRQRLDDQIREQGIQDLMKLTMPSTYVQAAVGQGLPELANFAIDMVGFGGIGNASKIVRGMNNLGKMGVRVIDDIASPVLEVTPIGRRVLPVDMAYRRTLQQEIDDIASSGVIRKMPDGVSVPKPESDKVRRFSLHKSGGNSHGGKAFAKGEPWYASTSSGNKKNEVIYGVPGTNSQWRVGHHGSYTGYQNFDDIEHGAGLWLPFDEDGIVNLPTTGLKVYRPNKFGRYVKQPFSFNTKPLMSGDDFTFKSSNNVSPITQTFSELDLAGRGGKYTTGTSMSVSDDTRQIFLNSVLPRRQMHYSKMNWPILDSNINHSLNRGHYVYPESTFINAGKDNYAGFAYPGSLHVSLRKGLEDFAEGHEYRHRYDFVKPLNSKEKKYLQDAFGSEFERLPSLYPELGAIEPEMITTNYDIRKALLGAHRLKTLDVRLQNKMIDKMSDDAIFNAIQSANGYGRKYADLLQKMGTWTHEKARAHREALKYVGAMSIPITLGLNAKQYTQNELRNK